MMNHRTLTVLIAIAALAASVHAQQTRPNVIIILADDMGFSDPGCFGGEIHTPNIDHLASQGVRFSQFYNMARCCPTRASIMTGLYPHQAGIGAMNQNLGRPAYQGELNDRCVTIAEVLREAGYHTGMAGKWHLCHLTINSGGPRAKRLLNYQEEAPVSPSKANWPCNRGFEEHWGTIAGVEDYYDPYSLVHNEQTIKPEGKGFYYTDFITDHSVQMIDQFAGGSGGGKKPFFLYVAYTAPHWPMQARESDVAKYEETYKVGWDEIRAARFERQVAMGLVKKEWGLSPRAEYRGVNEGASSLGPWEAAQDKAWQSRRMAVYAGMIEAMDRGIGKIMDTLRDKNLEQNTLVFFLSDNGGCAENVHPEWYDVPSKTRDGREIHVGNNPNFMPGPEEVYQSYGPAWANASNTPFRRFKHWTEEGGISAPFIARWPAVIRNSGSIDLDHVGDTIDFMPTILEVANAQYPKEFHGHAITPEEGRSLVPALTWKAFDRGPLFWEHEGNRAVRVGNYKLVAAHNEPWQLYDLATDRTELKNLAKEKPEKVEELKKEYEQWAKRAGVESWPISRR
jgi:arylsulfatase A-like enzyme